MRFLRLAIGLVVAAAIHFALAHVPGAPRIVDPFLVVVVWLAIGAGRVKAQLLGLTVGAVHDAISGGFFGFFAFADTAVGYGVASLTQRMAVTRRGGLVLVFALASALQQTIQVGLLLVLVDEPELPHPGWAVVRIGTAALLGLFVVMAEERLGTRWNEWRAGRSQKLRFR